MTHELKHLFQRPLQAFISKKRECFYMFHTPSKCNLFPTQPSENEGAELDLEKSLSDQGYHWLLPQILILRASCGLEIKVWHSGLPTLITRRVNVPVPCWKWWLVAAEASCAPVPSCQQVVSTTRDFCSTHTVLHLIIRESAIYMRTLMWKEVWTHTRVQVCMAPSRTGFRFRGLWQQNSTPR